MIGSLEDLDDPDFFNFEEKPESPKLEKSKSLPSWLAEADNALNKFKVEYDQFKKGHEKLTSDLKEFNQKEKEARQEYFRRKYFLQNEEKKVNKKTNLDDVHKSELVLIAKFVSKDYAPTLVRLTRVSRSFYMKLKESNVWGYICRDYFGN
jgi:hypothetical protein